MTIKDKTKIKLPHVTEIKSIQVSLAIIFIALGVIAAIINFNFQLATDQREETLRLTRAIHESDIINDKQTDHLINTTVTQIDRLFDSEKNATAIITKLLLTNQQIIKNTTDTNLKQTFVNRKNIQELVDEVRAFNLTQIKQHQSQEMQNLTNLNLKLDKLLNVTK